MSGVQVKLEPPDYETTHCNVVSYNNSGKGAEKLNARPQQPETNPLLSRRNEFDNENFEAGQQTAEDDFAQRSSVSDEMPTLIPIRSSRGLTNGTFSGPQYKPIYTKQRSLTSTRRPISDSDANTFCGTAAHTDVFMELNSSISVSEINRKLNILLANQNKIMLQNDQILSRLNSSSQRGVPVPHASTGRLDSGSKAADVAEERADKRSARGETPHVMPNSVMGGGGSNPALYAMEPFPRSSELDLGPPPRKSRVLSVNDGRSTAGSRISTPRSPTRDFPTYSVPMAASNACQGNACQTNACQTNACQTNACQTNACQTNACQTNAQVLPANSVLPLYANQCNMAVYVLRGGEEPNHVTVLPVQCNQVKSGSTKSRKNSSILSAQPVLLYNASSRQYEPSYVTGIAHQGPVGAQSEAPPRDESLPSVLRPPSERPPSYPGGSLAPSYPAANIPNCSDVHPNITNVVSLRKESAPTSEERCQNLMEDNLEASVSPPAQIPCSSPPSPIIIEEDTKPVALPSQEDLLHSQLRSFSMRNYAVQLMRALFRPHELMHRSVYEHSERKGLDKKRLQQIKDYVFQIYPTPSKEKSLAWIECISAMNEAIRSMK